MESTATLPDRKFICFVTQFVSVDNNAINEIQPYIFLAWVTRIIFDIVYFRAQIIMDQFPYCTSISIIKHTTNLCSTQRYGLLNFIFKSFLPLLRQTAYNSRHRILTILTHACHLHVATLNRIRYPQMRKQTTIKSLF